jgi:hypothetical protein
VRRQWPLGRFTCQGGFDCACPSHLATRPERDKKLHDRYGDQLVCVRYRYDAARQRRLKTIELIVEEVPWRPARAMRKGAEMVGVRVAVHEVALQRQVKLAGGRWNPAHRVWELRRDQALQLGLKDRIEHVKVSISRNS